MIDGLKLYTAMKESGLPWLKEVPEHWLVRPLGRMGQLFKGNGSSKVDEVSSGVPCVRYGDLYTQHEFFIRKSRSFVTAERSAYYTPIRNGDILFAASGETIDDIGRSGTNLIEGAACCGGDVIVFRANSEVIPKFLGYACDSWAAKWQKARMGRGFTVVHIYAGELKHLSIAVPPISEQAAIVRFLDYADARVRRYIRAKQKLIKLLGKEKQAIVHRAVTRGIDSNARLKPSGVEWLGEVPEHWEVRPLSRLLAQRKEKNDPIKTSNILSLSLDTGVIPYAEKKPGGNKAKDDLSAYMLAYPGDIVVNSMNVVVGSVGLSKYFGAVSPVYYMLYPRNSDDLVEFFDAIFQDTVFQKGLFGLGNGILVIKSRSSGKLNTIRMRIPMSKLKLVQLPYPHVQEQAAIVEHIARTTATIDKAIDKAGYELNLLKEYRTRLISDVVTGKFDVREAAARLPEEVLEVEPLDEIEDMAEDEGAADDEELEAVDAA